MDLDNVKELWNNEQPGNLPVISLEKQKELHSPLEKIRRNMRMEFWINIVSLIILIPLFDAFSENRFLKGTLLFVFLFILTYYTLKFYKSYKKLNLSFDTYHQLLELKYELRLNVELYQSYYVSSVPFFMGMLFLILEKKEFFRYPDFLMSYMPFLFFFVLIVLLLGFGNWWLNHYYVKYIRQFNAILDELKP